VTAPLTVLYIGGLGRSGSTLLDRMLGQLPGACSVGELGHLWVRGLGNDERCGCGEAFSSCPFWRQVGDFAVDGWDTQDARSLQALQRSVDRNRYIPLLLAPWLSPSYRRRLDAYTNVLAHIYEAIGKASERTVVVDSTKHASTAFVLRHVDGVDLRVVHLVRDPRGVAHSWLKTVPKPEVVGARAYMARLSPPRMSVRWVAYNLLFHLLALVGVPTVFLRYEDLVADPRRELARTLRLIARDADGDDLSFVEADAVTLSPAHSVAGNPMRFRQGRLVLRRDEAWREQLPTTERRTVEALTAPLRWRYGYRRPSSPPAPGRTQPDPGAQR
jgi:hypothetical protein